MTQAREVTYTAQLPQNVDAFLVGDIGGTNSNFGVFCARNNQEILLVSMHYKSQEITDFSAVLQQVITLCATKYHLTIQQACLAAAGIISADRRSTKPTNLNFTINVDDILHKTSLKNVLLANDFEVIGHGLHRLNPQDIVQIKSGTQQPKANQAIIGAGTGLGKCILLWEEDRNHYSPVASEGGHADFAAQTELEYELVTFIKRLQGTQCTISWEDVLCGEGIKRIYQFFKQRNNTHASSDQLKTGLPPDEIFKSRTLDEHAFNTYELYTKFYARCAKNFALDALARGGIYIAGGIAAKNVDMFRQSIFLDEFIRCGKQEALLLEIPIFVIADYNVSLYGAIEYMKYEGLC